MFLKSDRVSRMVQSGGCSASDSREVFKKHIEKRVRSLPEIDGLSKETVLSSWIAKFDIIYRGEEDPRKHQQRMTASAASELILSKDQLYEMFQQILGIKKFEHQLLYNACQVRRGHLCKSVHCQGSAHLFLLHDMENIKIYVIIWVWFWLCNQIFTMLFFFWRKMTKPKELCKSWLESKHNYVLFQIARNRSRKHLHGPENPLSRFLQQAEEKRQCLCWRVVSLQIML